MIAEEMNEALKQIGWSTHELARRLRISDRRLRHMLAGREEIPDNLDRWLRMWAQTVTRLPQLPEGWVVRRRADD
jgi:hypothetical protein